MLTFVYIDEFGFNPGTQRHYGRAPAGHPAIQVTPANQGVNISVVAAVQKGRGIVYYKARDGAFTAATFNQCIDEVLAQFTSPPVPNVCFVMDNCRIHDKNDLPNRLDEAGVALQFLPAYSPMLNPMEELIGDVKHAIRTLLSVQFADEALRDLAIATITPQTVDDHFAHSYGFLARAVRQESI